MVSCCANDDCGSATCLSPFRGTTVALLADVHHGPFVPLAYIRHVVSMTNALKPTSLPWSVILSIAMIRTSHLEFIELGKLKGTLGRFAVRGNHDNHDYYGERSFRLHSQAALAEAKLPDLNNTGIWIERAGSPVADLRSRRPLDRSSRPGPRSGRRYRKRCRSSVVAQPRLVETITRPSCRPGVERAYPRGPDCLPGYGAPIVPSRYGQKYLHGLVAGPCCRVFVTAASGPSRHRCDSFAARKLF